MSQAEAPWVGQQRTELKALTGLRFIAALAVVMSHVQAPDDSPRWVKMIFLHGFIGVAMFFMLSGVVLSWNYPALSLRHGRDVVRFYVARIARIMPLYWAVLAYLVVIRGASGGDRKHLWWHVFAIQTWSGNADVAFTFNSPGWSIGVELFFYALFPVLVPVVAALARRGSGAVLALFGACFTVQVVLVLLFQERGWATLPFTNPSSAHRWLYHNPVMRLPDFVAGLCLGFLLHRGVRIGTRVATAIQLFVVAWTVGWAAVPHPDYDILAGWYYSALWTVPFGALMITLAVSPRAPLTRLLSTGPLLTLGTASYALYLTHAPAKNGLGDQFSRNVSGLREWVLILFTVGALCLVAEGAHRYIEVPGRHLLLRLSPARRPDTRAPAGPGSEEHSAGGPPDGDDPDTAVPDRTVADEPGPTPDARRPVRTSAR